ncbi:unnamed protein product [marine sediment metagenome]|uniref:Uncharacterized protein n=1 Tax=marine sediment metagenome TaxID=412755 RepID=X0VS25_9ZZZZ
MRSEKEIRKAIKDKKKEYKYIMNPPKQKPCKQCGHTKPILGSFNIVTMMVITDRLRPEISILEWVLNEK